MRSTPARCPDRTLDQSFRYPLGPSPRWGAWWLSEFCTQSLSCPTLRSVSEEEAGKWVDVSLFLYVEFYSHLEEFSVAYRAAVLDDGVSEPAVALRPHFLSVGASEDESFLKVAGLLVLKGHAVPAVIRDVLVRLLWQKLQQLHLDCHGVGLLLLAAVEELKRDDKRHGFWRAERFPLQSFSCVLTLAPLFISAPNQVGLLGLGVDFVHQALRGMLAGLAGMQVSPVSMLHKTLMASFMLPWFGSNQYSPATNKMRRIKTCDVV